MGRGRKRKHNPTIPAHIEQDKLPAGIYWDGSGNGRWYVIEPNPEGGLKKPTVAGSVARLSDLHSIMEGRAGGDQRGTVGFVMAQFRLSTEYTKLAKTTRDDYDYCEKEIRKVKTRLGFTFDKLVIDRLETPVFQRLNENIARGENGEPRPTKANKIQRYLRRTIAWGKRHGHCRSNPAAGVKLAKERKQFKMPERTVYATVVAYAQRCGALKPHTKGSCPPYLWCVMEIAYLCRMRGIEVIQLTDAHATEDGLKVSRVKGSNANVVRWNPRLRAAWNAVLELRAAIVSKRSRPIPIRAEQRYVFVNQSGGRLSKSALNQAWQDFMPAAIRANVITIEQRFTLHGLKHRGVTDTQGNKAVKKQASGHKTDAAFEVYDHEVPVVEPAVAPEFSGEFSGVIKK
jgi:site-specific recombinase XerD